MTSKLTKRSISILLVLLFTMAIPFTSFAKTETKTKSSAEFGTLTGTIGNYMSGDRKCVNYRTTTTKTAPTIIAEVRVCLYDTGAQISSGEVATAYNAKYTGYDWECHSATNNKKKMSAFGRHEARGQGSLGVNTEIINF